jgi:GR25 family glycosyltransferase involved in LPS biosynthesis
MLIDKIFYINLEHRDDRRKEIEKELNNFNLPYERFPAILHPTIGGVGCGKSHIEVLKLAKSRGYKRVMILEDDFMFTVSKEQFECNLSKLDNVKFDVCLISYHLIDSINSNSYPFLRKVNEAQTTSGYIINDNYYDILIDLFSSAVINFEATNQHWLYAIDVAWKKLQKRDLWYCFNPRLGKQRPSYSDCGNTYNQEDW